jgi:hypothetical protein
MASVSSSLGWHVEHACRDDHELELTSPRNGGNFLVQTGEENMHDLTQKRADHLWRGYGISPVLLGARISLAVLFR